MTDLDDPRSGSSAPEPTDVTPVRRRVSARRVLTIAIALVLLCEVAVRVLEPALPAPSGWPDTATATKAAQLGRLAASGCTDVVFVGNSMTRDDLVPAEFTRADPNGRSAYNAALDAASPRLLERWVEDEVLPATDPATVIIGLASFDLNDDASTPGAALRSYDAAAFTADGRGADAESFLTRNIALVRNREALRDPSVVTSALIDRLRGRSAPRPTSQGIDGVIAPDGHGLSRRDLRFGGDRSTVERMRRQFLDPFDVGGRQVDALQSLIEVIEDHGADAVIVVLPVTDAYLDAHPDGRSDLEAFRVGLDRAVAGTGATVLDVPERPVADFADTQHLNGDGADALSAMLPQLLRSGGVPARECA